MLRKPKPPNHVQLLAMKNPASVLAAACACRSAAELVHQHPRSIPDSVVAEIVARFDSLLKAALDSVVEC